MTPRVIDMHSHFFPREWEDLAKRFGGEWPWMKHLGEQRVGSLIRDMDGLCDAARARLLAGNARRFLGLAA